MNTSTGTRFVNPEAVVTHFHLDDGDKIADFGAGTGYFIKILSEKVGNNGRVYALEIQKNLVEKIGLHAQELKLSNVEPMWCDLEIEGGAKIASDILDTGILINTLFQVVNKPVALKEMARTIKGGGKFFVVDWTESFAGLGPHTDQVVTESMARALIEEAGFQFDRTFPSGDHHYGLAFRKV